MAAPVWESVATNTAENVNQITANKPAGVVAGDVLSAALATSGTNDAMSPPDASWKEVNQGTATSQRLGAWTKVATSNEPANYTFTWAGAADDRAILVIGRISGASTGKPVDVSGAATGGELGGSKDPQAPSITTTADECLLVALCSQNGEFTFTPPAGYTERWDLNSPAAVTDTSSSGATNTKATAGATGAATFTSSAMVAPAAWRALHVAIQPVHATKVLSDSVSLADEATIEATLTLTDSATLTEDTPSIEATLAIADTGTASEAVSIEATVSLDDTATLAESVSILAELDMTDTATLSDTATKVVYTTGGNTITYVFSD